jgi:hypothetical protein
MNTKLDLRQRARAPALLVVLIANVMLLGACGGDDYSNDGGSGGNNCGGAYGSPCPPTSAGTPSVALAAVAANVNRTVVLTATPTAPNGVTRVEFLVDGTVIGMATASPYTANWDTSTIADGVHSVTARVTDMMGLTAASVVATAAVANNITIAFALTAGEEYPQPTSTATGAGQLAVNLVTGAINGNFMLTGMTATAAHIHDAYAGNTGAIQVGFVANGAIVNRWDLPAGALLTAPQVNRLLAGALYVNAHSAAYPAGEIRAQMKPASITVVYAPMSGAQEVPPVAGAASGVAAVTIDTVASTASVHLNSTGVNDGNMAHIHTGAAGVNGPVLFPLTQDAVRLGHWAVEQQAITAANLTTFNSNGWYANIHTPANVGGAIRGQITVTVPVATTLTQLQNTIFTPRCVACHSGVGGVLPGSMNLSSAANSYAALVNVASLQQGTAMRVAPNIAGGSYLVQKLEGAVTISGVRMPFGGPFLDQPTIDTVKSWINAGALNN